MTTGNNRGRPITGAEAKMRYQIALEPQIAERLRQFGGNNLSRGIALAAQKIPMVVQSKALHVNANGLSDALGEPPSPVEVAMARTFITECCAHLKQLQRKGTSYGWKHIAESWFRDGSEGGPRRPHGAPPYISNGAFLAAAIELGYELKRTDPKSPNAFLNMNLRKDVKARYRRAGNSWNFGAK